MVVRVGGHSALLSEEGAAGRVEAPRKGREQLKGASKKIGDTYISGKWVVTNGNNE